MSKKNLGQFNTTRKDYILEGFEPMAKGKLWVDPFAGNGDLLDWVMQHGAEDVEGFDVDPSKVSSRVKIHDSLRNPQSYKGKFVIANPPYLAKNKNKTEMEKDRAEQAEKKKKEPQPIAERSVYVIHGQDDLYKIAIKTICEGNAKGGILIVPLNFLCSEYADSIRRVFFAKYKIINCKIFEETVFDDTTYTVCAFVFRKLKSNEVPDKLKVLFKPSGEVLVFPISEEYGWVLGQDFYKYIDGVDTKGVGRWTVQNGSNGGSFKTKEEGEAKGYKRGTVYINDFQLKPTYKKKKPSEDSEAVKFTDRDIINGPKNEAYFRQEVLNDVILIRAIDTGSESGQLGLQDIREVRIKRGSYPVCLGLETSRNLAHVRFDPPIGIESQMKVIDHVNAKLREFRAKYRSVFLTSYRNSTSFCSRKRIGFDVVYRMINKAREELGI